MDVSKLQVGQVYSYKQLCELTGAEYKKGAGKTYQLEKFGATGFQRFFSFEKIGRGKYEIFEIYDKPLPIEDDRRYGNHKGYINIKEDCFLINDVEIAHRPGVYKIENSGYIYIGSTIKWFTLRFSQHFYNYYGKHDKTQEILKNGGTFVCLQSFENGTDEQIIRECEAEYIRKYRNTDKVLLNDRIPEVLSKEEKIDYETIKIPKDYLDDIKEILMDSGYLIMGKVVFNKKFLDNEF